ncbi:hypothetical protein SAMN05880561_104393 [Rhizobium sp. RU33A]|nr:hypothetical protein SAMN05880561_104393 [Rhizobium sp. RU33A]
MRGGGKWPIRLLRASKAAGPLILTTATPDGKPPDANAQIVSFRVVTRSPSATQMHYRPKPAPHQVFIESKKSPLFFVCLSLSMRNSMASVVPIGARIRRRTKIFWRS